MRLEKSGEGSGPESAKGVWRWANVVLRSRDSMIEPSKSTGQSEGWWVHPWWGHRAWAQLESDGSGKPLLEGDVSRRGHVCVSAS